MWPVSLEFDMWVRGTKGEDLLQVLLKRSGRDGHVTSLDAALSDLLTDPIKVLLQPVSDDGPYHVLQGGRAVANLPV